MKYKPVEEPILQSLEHELGGVEVYTTAILCAKNADLKKEWQKYMAETRTHVTALETVCSAMELDAAKETPGRAVLRHNGPPAARPQPGTPAESRPRPGDCEAHGGESHRAISIGAVLDLDDVKRG